ncbi:hypothetical protein [Aurantibacter sp.]|uniref:hypothetical protein n=1 Tax=Aurantibacter sp. TaxID=2807103 RepID=UPI0035C7B796
MNKIKIIFLIIGFSFNYSTSQTINTNKKKAYIPLKHFKQKYKRPLTKKDSLSFIFRENDTLVFDELYKEPKGTKVAYEYKDDNFLKIYKKVVYKKIKDSSKNKSYMHYWKDDIKMYISNSFDKKVKKEFLKFTKNISQKIDSLNIYEVKNPKDSNYIIYLDSDFQYKPRIMEFTQTDYYVYWNGKNQMHRLSLRILDDSEFTIN